MNHFPQKFINRATYFYDHYIFMNFYVLKYHKDVMNKSQMEEIGPSFVDALCALCILGISIFLFFIILYFLLVLFSINKIFLQYYMF